MLGQTIDIVQLVGNYLGIIVIPIMTIILGRKVLKERKQINQLNIIRFIIFCIFLTLYGFLISDTMGPNIHPSILESYDG